MNQATPAKESVSVVGEHDGLQLAIKRSSTRSLGKIISRPDSADLIDGVVVEPLQVHPDDRGFFAELARLGSEGIAARMIADGQRQIQISTTLTYPGTIKAIHYHFEQTDLWAPVGGMLQVFLCDLRETSPSCGQVNTLFLGTFRPWKLRIPPGIAHGYKVIGNESAQLVYATNRFYNPEDEGRIPYDDPDINYDWQRHPR